MYLKICEREGRVGGSLREDELGVGLDGRLDDGRIGKVHKGELNAPIGEHLAGNTIGAAVRAVRDYTVVAL